MKNLIVIFNVIDLHHNDHNQRCRQRHHCLVLLNQNNNSAIILFKLSVKQKINYTCMLKDEKKTQKTKQKHMESLQKCFYNAGKVII